MQTLGPLHRAGFDICMQGSSLSTARIPGVQKQELNYAVSGRTFILIILGFLTID